MKGLEMKIRVAIRHDEPDAKAAIKVESFQTHNAPGFNGIRESEMVVLPGEEKCIDAGDGVYLRITETALPDVLVSEDAAAEDDTEAAIKVESDGVDDAGGVKSPFVPVVLTQPVTE